MSHLTDVRGRPVRPGDLVAWADSHKRGRIRYGEVTGVVERLPGLIHPQSHKFTVTIVEDTDDRDAVTTIKNTSNLVVIEALDDESEIGRTSRGERVKVVRQAAQALGARFLDRGQFIR